MPTAVERVRRATRAAELGGATEAGIRSGGDPLDITKCPNCGGRLRVIADVTDPAVIEKILKHVSARSPLTIQIPDSSVLF